MDGHFQRAGFDEQAAVECHGSIHHLQCSRPCGSRIWPADAVRPEIDEATCRLLSPLPTCPDCGAISRPNILMFSDGAWDEARTAAQEALLDRWLSRSARMVVLEIGAASDIPTVRSFSHRMIIDHDALLIRINPREPALPRARDISLAGPALKVLKTIDELLRCG